MYRYAPPPIGTQATHLEFNQLDQKNWSSGGVLFPHTSAIKPHGVSKCLQRGGAHGAQGFGIFNGNLYRWSTRKRRDTFMSDPTNICEDSFELDC